MRSGLRAEPRTLSADLDTGARRRFLGALIVLATLCPTPTAAGDPGLVLIYPSHGRPDGFEIIGRFLEDEGVSPPRANSSRLRNLIDNVLTLESDEIEDALVEVQVGRRVLRARSDDDGVWRVQATNLQPGMKPGRHRVRARAVDDQGHPAPEAVGWLHIVPAGPGTIVVSDFDDTVVHSEVTNWLRMAKNALTRNASQMRPVRGAAAAYVAAKRAGGVAIIYVSGSPQNFMPRIVHFLEHNGFPAGPILLKNFGVGRGSDPTFDQKAYKLARLQRLLDRYPEKRFVLVGDSGERDPEIYRAVARAHPQRISGIVIRRVPGGDNRDKRFAGMVMIDDFREPVSVIARLLDPLPKR